MRVTQILRYILNGAMAIHYSGATNLDNKLRVMTYNVRYDSMPDDISVQQTIDSLTREIPSQPPHFYANTSEKPWSTRRIHVANDILLTGADIYGGAHSVSVLL